MDRKYKVGGYVKLAKLWERSKDAAVAYHSSYYAEKFRDDADKRLVGVYIDITGNKEIYKRPEMVHLLKDCKKGSVNLIFSQTRAYLAANTCDVNINTNQLFIAISFKLFSKRVARMVKTEMGIHCYQKKRKWYWSVQPEPFLQSLSRCTISGRL